MSNSITVIQKSKVKNFMVLVAVIFLVVFPKGGFKIAGIPITWGYLYLGFLGAFAFFSISKSFIFNTKALICYVATLPFMAYFIAHISVFGLDSSIGVLIAFFVSYMLMPILFLILLAGYLGKVDKNYIETLIFKGVLIISIYGILLFIIKQTTGKYIEVPYFTVNADEVTDLGNKYNQRGDIFKLISTYNNGNIFGVCTMFLFPVFYRHYKKHWQLVVVLVALLLTLSRTVWIGVIIFFMLHYRHRIVHLIKIYSLILGALFLVSTFLFTQFFQYGSMENFVLDPTFGGRLKQIEEAITPTFFGIEPFSNIDEIVYLSVYRQLGVVGFVLFTGMMLAPIIVFLRSKGPKDSAYLFSIIIYTILCMSDGCALLIPTLAFYNFVICMAFTPTPNLAKK